MCNNKLKWINIEAKHIYIGGVIITAVVIDNNNTSYEQSIIVD